MIKVVNTTVLKTTLFVNFIPLKPLGLFITTLLVLQRGGFVLLLFPLPFAAMPFSSFSTTTSRTHLAAVLSLVGFGITAGIDNEVNLLRSSSPY